MAMMCLHFDCKECGIEIEETVPARYIDSFKAACKYYSAQEGWDGIYRLVKSKEAEGLIKIGAPLIKQGQRLKIVDNGTRYAIEEI